MAAHCQDACKRPGGKSGAKALARSGMLHGAGQVRLLELLGLRRVVLRRVPGVTKGNLRKKERELNPKYDSG